MSPDPLVRGLTMSSDMKHLDVMMTKRMMMMGSGVFKASPSPLQVVFVRMCVFYAAVCLAGWPPSSEAARLRCGSDLLDDIRFVCGDRGIYIGRSGYGARPRGKGIVEKCCRAGGCELQLLEMYCAKPKSQRRQTTAAPTTTTAPRTATQLDTTQQLQAVFLKRLSEHLGAPGGPKREGNRKKTQASPRRKSKVPSSRRRIKGKTTTSRPPSTSGSRPLRRMMTVKS
ncbi:Insulin-like growth factor II-B [Liparis tanakae]|uniref:Insulin-like growth factor II-B n=1 Tax=Liparis tanakae TaxID=230148 RepID=A0A4Z2GID2_9TELE|nr:Insulin-like growth factor II-B [Liparis tanakae]